MITKFIIFLVAGYVVLKAVKGVLGQSAPMRMRPGDDQGGVPDGLMVRDPHCQTYILKQKAVRATHRGIELYFCSERCRDAFLKKSEP